MRLSLLGCKTARAGGRVKGGRSPFILTLDAVFCPCNLRGKLPRMEASARTRSRPRTGAFRGDWGAFPNKQSTAVCTAVPCLPLLFRIFFRFMLTFLYIF